MANFTMVSAFDMKSKALWDGVITGRTANTITFSDGINTTIFSGTFTYSGTTITAGTISSYSQRVNGVEIMQVTGLNFSALEAQRLWDISDKVGLREKLLLGQDAIAGSTGNDTIYGGLGGDTITGNDGNDVIYGGGGSDYIYGGAGNDTIYAGGFAQMEGGAGDDRYIVNSSSTIITESINSGTDTVEIATSHTLTSNVENLILTGTGAISGTGNASNNVITGNNGSNILNGAAGNDTLYGGGGNDRLTGGLGNDTFIFNTAPNRLTNIDFIADMATTDIIALDVDVFYELANGGTGVVRAISSAEFSSSGSATAATRIMYDRTLGNLFYDGDGSGSRVVPLQFANIANITKPLLTSSNFQIVTTIADSRTGNDALTGTSGNERINGYGGNDTIVGDAGNDTLIGGSGNDRLTGGLGNDVFIFQRTSAGGIDTVTDFTVNGDDIAIQMGIAPLLHSSTALASNAFRLDGQALLTTTRVIYNTTNGALYYDADGSGSAARVQIATINMGATPPNLSFADFILM